MGSRVTVLIPTFDNGRPIRQALRSALAQTHTDLEVLVVGDGTIDVTREIVAEVADADPRVRFFDNPKGPRHGEIHRHAALQEATGDLVCYLCDDDLWLPDHLEHLVAALDGADFAHTMTFLVFGDGTITTWIADLADPDDRRIALEHRVPLSLSQYGHTMDAYRRLPRGWHTTPAHEPNTDAYMVRRWLQQPWVRARSVSRFTAVHLARSFWTDRPDDERLAAVEAWAERVADPAWRENELPGVAWDTVIGAGRLAEQRAWRHQARIDHVVSTRWWKAREWARAGAVRVAGGRRSTGPG